MTCCMKYCMRILIIGLIHGEAAQEYCMAEERAETPS